MRGLDNPSLTPPSFPLSLPCGSLSGTLDLMLEGSLQPVPVPRALQLACSFPTLPRLALSPRGCRLVFQWSMGAALMGMETGLPSSCHFPICYGSHPTAKDAWEPHRASEPSYQAFPSVLGRLREKT